jgi:hypothetical protein
VFSASNNDHREGKAQPPRRMTHHPSPASRATAHGADHGWNNINNAKILGGMREQRGDEEGMAQMGEWRVAWVALAIRNGRGVESRNDGSTGKLECVLVVEMALCRHVYL